MHTQKNPNQVTMYLTNRKQFKANIKLHKLEKPQVLQKHFRL